MPEQTESPAHAALRMAGYRCHGVMHGLINPGAILWQRRAGESVWLNIFEWSAGTIPEARYEMELTWHDERDAARVLLYSYTPADLAARLPELERRALAAMRALRGEGA